MDKQETAEAIIVVGPFLWKCVNCDILMSRQHSIDYHLVKSHNSKLQPSAVKEDLINHCRISTCSCHKVSKVSNHKRKRNKTSHKSSLNKRKKTTESDDHSMFTLNSSSPSNESNNRVEQEEEDSFVQELWASVQKNDNANEKVSNLSSISNSKNCATQVTTPLKSFTTLGEWPVLNCQNSETEEASKADKNAIISKEDFLVVNPENSEQEAEPKTIDKYDHEGLPVNSDESELEEKIVEESDVHVSIPDIHDTGVRKSRRSTKGRNSLFKEFDMGIS